MRGADGGSSRYAAALRGQRPIIAPSRHARRIGAALEAESKVVPMHAPRLKDRFWLGAGSGGGGMATAAALAFFLILPRTTADGDDQAEAHLRSLVGDI